MKEFIGEFLSDESGVTSIEYGLIVAIVSVGIIGVLQPWTPKLNNHFGNVASNLN